MGQEYYYVCMLVCILYGCAINKTKHTHTREQQILPTDGKSNTKIRCFLTQTHTHTEAVMCKNTQRAQKKSLSRPLFKSLSLSFGGYIPVVSVSRASYILCMQVKKKRKNKSKSKDKHAYMALSRSPRLLCNMLLALNAATAVFCVHTSKIL